MAKKITWYRLRTGCPKMPIYMIHESPAWQDILQKAKAGKLGNIAGTQYPITPEMKFTEEMLLETFVDETDEEGILDTEDKELAKYVLMSIKHFAAVPHYEESDADKAVPKYMEYFRKVLDKDSPQDILEELEESLRYKLSPKARRDMLEAKRAAVKNTK